jgi:hypothetical protein
MEAVETSRYKRKGVLEEETSWRRMPTIACVELCDKETHLATRAIKALPHPACATHTCNNIKQKEVLQPHDCAHVDPR